MAEWNLDDAHRRNISDLGAAVRRLRGVVNDLVTFSGTSPDGRHESVQFNIRDIIQTVIECHRPIIEASRLRVHFNIPSSLPMNVIGRKDQLVCVLDQLIGNAIKFTPEGSVTVEVRSLKPIEAGNLQREYTFEIKDTGIGLTPDEINSIFQPFSQMDGGAGRAYEGVGLGLTLAARMVHSWGHGGTISVASEGRGRGSTFSFSAVFTAVDSIVQSGSDLRRASLLVVDEDGPTTGRIVQLVEMLGLGFNRVSMADLTNELLRSSDGVIFCLPATPTPSMMIEIHQRISQISGSAPIRPIIVGGSEADPPVLNSGQGFLPCQYFSRPPTLRVLKRALGSLVGADRGNSIDCTETGASHHSQQPQSASKHSICTLQSGPLTSRSIVISPITTSSTGSAFARGLEVTDIARGVEVTDFPSLDDLHSKYNLLPPPASQNLNVPGEVSHSNSSSFQRILCVEDCSVIRRLLVSIIQKAGFLGKIDTAIDSEEALALGERHRYDLIFMDFNLPGMTGAEITRRLRTCPSSSSVDVSINQTTPIIGVTAAPSMREECLAAGIGVRT